MISGELTTPKEDAKNKKSFFQYPLSNPALQAKGNCQRYTSNKKN
jgi:hypothetical protein